MHFEVPSKSQELVSVKPEELGVGTHKELSSEEQTQAGQKELKSPLRDTTVGLPYQQGMLVI